MFATVDRIGQHIFTSLQQVVQLLLLTYLSLRSTLIGQTQGWRTLFSVIAAQIYFTGWQAMPLIGFLAIGSGALVALQSMMQMSLLGGVDYVGRFMLMIVVREIAPLLTALIVIARSGTAVAAELGSMQVNKEIDALKAMGINPLSFVIFPRLVGGVISVLSLAFYFVLFATISGALVCRVLKGMPFDVFFTSLAQAASFGDVLIFVLKNLCSGFTIFAVSCYQGLRVERSPHEIPQVTTQAVVKSTVYVLVCNFMLTLYFYLDAFLNFGVL